MDREQARIYAESFLNWYDYEDEQSSCDCESCDLSGSHYSEDDYLEELEREYF